MVKRHGKSAGYSIVKGLLGRKYSSWSCFSIALSYFQDTNYIQNDYVRVVHPTTRK
jgi:hypothetical protein